MHHSDRDDLDGAEILAPRSCRQSGRRTARRACANEVEAAERPEGCAGRWPRRFDVAIPPSQLQDPEQMRRGALVRDYAQRSFVDRGMVADIDRPPWREGGQHVSRTAHIMLTDPDHHQRRACASRRIGSANKKEPNVDDVAEETADADLPPGGPRPERSTAALSRDRSSQPHRTAGRGPAARRPPQPEQGWER